MLLSKLTKFLHPKSPKTSLRQEKPSEVTCVQSEEMEIRNSDEEIRNSDEEIRNKDEVGEVKTETDVKSTTAHLGGGVPKRVETPRGAMTKAEMREARELFEGLDDAEIHRLYKKVTQ